MRIIVSLALLGLVLGAVPASAQDYSAETALSAKRSKARAKPAATPVSLEAPADPFAAGRALRADFGWSVVTDPATGVRIGLPTNMVPYTKDVDNGTRWSSRYGEIQVETFRLKTADAAAALFERQKREPATRRSEYSLLKGDTFFISGLQGLKLFSVRAQFKNGELRGFTMLYDQALEGIVAPTMVAMSSAFAPFPETTTPFANLVKSVEYGTALVVSSDGYLLADRKTTDNCQVIVASGLGSAERVATDERGLALLRVYGKGSLSPVQLAAATPGNAELTVMGVPDPNTQAGDRALSEVKARLVDGGVIELRQPVPIAGFSGAAALDAQGRVLGMMQTRNAVIASAQPVVPPVRLVAAASIRDFLAAHGVVPATAPADPKASIIRVICVRQ